MKILIAALVSLMLCACLYPDYTFNEPECGDAAPDETDAGCDARAE